MFVSNYTHIHFLIPFLCSRNCSTVIWLLDSDGLSMSALSELATVNSVDLVRSPADEAHTFRCKESSPRMLHKPFRTFIRTALRDGCRGALTEAVSKERCFRMAGRSITLCNDRAVRPHRSNSNSRPLGSRSANRPLSNSDLVCCPNKLLKSALI